ncbi:hypothetical protein [Methylobacterium symbioticum]|nr:hypothetical protein [Methylobacterium symbioticum]
MFQMITRLVIVGSSMLAMAYAPTLSPARAAPAAAISSPAA